MSPLLEPAACVDCDAPAVGLRKNLDREPSCLACEADRLAMIMMLLAASTCDSQSEQLTLLSIGDRR